MKLTKLLLFLIILIIIFQFVKTNNSGDIANYSKNITIKPFSVPVQEDLIPKEEKYKINYSYNKHTYTIFPLYRYRIYAKIYSKKHYTDMGAAPYDLALGWDGLEKKEAFNNIGVSQHGRWVYWKLKKDCPYDVDQVYLRLANNHIIPANKNILKGLQKVKRGDDVYIEGYLVRYEIKKDGKVIGSNQSSTTRTDRGDHSCEIVYATKLISKYGEFK